MSIPTMFYNVKVITTNQIVKELLLDSGYDEYETNIFIKPQYEYNNYADMILDTADLLKCNYKDTTITIV